MCLRDWIAGGLALGLLGARARPDDVAIGSIFVWILGLGVLFLSIFTAGQSGSGDGTAGVRVLFGSIFGLSAADVRLAAAVGAGGSVLLVAIARPLLFASIDPVVAAARRVPVRLLGVGFLGLTGLVAAEGSHAVGAMLLLGLLAAPAAAAHRLTVRPYQGLLLSALIALGSVWLGLTLAYYVPRLPPGSAVIFVAVAAYVIASAWALAPRHARGDARRGVRT
jgi:zinc/manganese transport system permease protein